MTERIFKDAAALEEATDHVIRDMTQVDVSEDAVRRVMARVRAAGAGDANETRSRSESGWFGALLAPRVSWGMMASTAARTRAMTRRTASSETSTCVMSRIT